MNSDLIGKSLPSAKYGAWIVNEVRGTRARLLTGDMKGEMWMDVDQLRSLLKFVEDEYLAIEAQSQFTTKP